MANHFKGAIEIHSNNTTIRQQNAAGTDSVDLPFINDDDQIEISAPIGGADLVVQEQIVQTKIEFNHPPAMYQVDGTIAANVDDEINIHRFDGRVLYCHNIGTQTTFAPAVKATGLDYGMTQTDNIGLGIVSRLNGSKGILDRDYFVVGTSEAFHMSMKFSVETVAGMDRNIVGFRKDEAVQDDYEDFDEKACIGVISGNITISTTLGGAIDIVTDTTDNLADGETVTLDILVSAAGVVTYTIDGDAPTITKAFTFADGEIVVPCFQFENANGSQVGELILQEFVSELQ